MHGDRVGPLTATQLAQGEHFYGRTAHINEILDGPRDCLWLLGTRRIGKTFLLRHVGQLAQNSPEKGYVPAFWKLRDADNPAALSASLHDGLSEARLDLHSTTLQTDVLAAIERARRELRSKERKLLLLCDEAEGLARLRNEHPVLLRKLGRTLQSGEDVRTVLASTLPLWALAEERSDASPFLQAFIPPLYLQALSDEEARCLIWDIAVQSDVRPAVDEAGAERLRECAGGHPYLVRLLCARTTGLGSVDEAIRQTAADSELSARMSSDLQFLPQADQEILRALGGQSTADVGQLRAQLALRASVLKTSLFRLESLGLIRRRGQDRFTIGNAFLPVWMAGTHRQRAGRRAASSAREVVAAPSRIELMASSDPDELFEAVYDPLRNLARRYLGRERREHTLQPTALVHEAYLKLVDQTRVSWKGRTHFFAVGANAMRRILIDHARSHRRAKRGGKWFRVTLSGLQGVPIGPDLDPAQLLALHTALEELARVDERQARVVELRFFAGLSMSEVAEVLGVSKRTADGDWARARAWLERELAGAAGAHP